MTDNRIMGIKPLSRYFDVVPDTMRQWRHRADDWPEPVAEVPYPVYRLGDVWYWMLRHKPHKTQNTDVYLHTFIVGPGGLEMAETILMGPLCEARGYLKAIRDLKYLAGDWKVWSTIEGFCVTKDATTHVYALDPSEEPDEWWTYEQRFKAAKV